MPLLLHQPIAPHGELGLWRIAEAEAELRGLIHLAEAERHDLEAIKGEGRRREWLACRHLLHLMSGRSLRGALLKDAYGKPYLEGSPWQISISHSAQVAACVAAPVPCGVDVQLIVPKIERIARRFMRPEELDSLAGAERLAHLHVYWGAKEALYKAYGRRELDFCQHIHIRPFAYAGEGSAQGRIWKGGLHWDFELRYMRHGEHVLVYALQQASASALG